MVPFGERAHRDTAQVGATVTLRDPASLRVKDRRRVIAAANNEERLLQAMSLSDGLIAALVVEWSLDLIVPSAEVVHAGRTRTGRLRLLDRDRTGSSEGYLPQDEQDARGRGRC